MRFWWKRQGKPLRRFCDCLQTYKAEIASLFATNALLAISDGVEAWVRTLGALRDTLF